LCYNNIGNLLPSRHTTILVKNMTLVECTLSMYLNVVLIWPDDGCLQPKYVALKFY